jgi:hypothetical protein
VCSFTVISETIQAPALLAPEKGTIGGVVDIDRIYAESTGKTRTATPAVLNSDGTLSGTFDGYEGWNAEFFRSCTGKGFGWTLRPR